jgi:tetratricopeptide (TPR) repeat protein
MDARQIIKAGVMVVFCTLASDCASIRSPNAEPDPDVPAGPGHPVVLSESSRDFAGALANYSEALRHELHDDHAAALSNYVAAARLDPANDSLQFRVALALMQEKRAAEAIALMEKAAMANPKSERTLIWLALIYRSAEQDDKALETYRKAMDAAPTSSVAYIESAALLTKKNNDADAIRILESALSRVGPNEEDDVTRALGELYLRDATGESQRGKRWGHLTEARKRFEAAVKKWPDDQTMRLMLGNLRALDNDIPGAIACYDELARKNPDDLSIKEKLAISLMASGNKTGAVAALEGIAARQPTNGRVFYLLGELYEQLGDKNKAILNFDISGRNTPEDPLPFLRSAMLSSALGNREAAEAILRKGLDGGREQPRLREMLAYVLMDQKKYDACLDAFSKAAAALSTSASNQLTQNFRVNYAIALQLAGKTAGAASMLAEARENNPSAVEIFASYMMREGSTNDLERTVTVLEALEKKIPNEARAPVYRGLVLSSLDRHREAVDAFERAEKIASGDPQAEKILATPFYFWYAAACERVTNIVRAAPLFLKSIALNPDDAEARNYLAYMWAEHGEHLDEALYQIRKALEGNPDNAAYRDTLGWIHYRKGDPEKALVETQKAVDKISDDPTINDHMGDILAKLGRKGDAVEYWKKAYICGNDTKQLPEKLRAAGVDIKSLDADAAAFKAKKETETRSPKK